ncbi:hypothetical protein CARUB_v10011894mg [Capsella rubella]|uniref:SURF1-like protein n=1 Tax=Capsella rubella TaxID=81985 RepID=R0GNR8_9BRAS|nr:hypothetical protein CARUB_v10011894mg [Capsella rubella]
MTKLFSKTLTRLISYSHRSSSTTSNLSTAPQTPDLESKWIIPVTPPAKTRVGSMWFWYLAGSITYGIGVAKKHVDFRLKCLETKPRKLNTMTNVDELGFQRVVCKGVFDVQRSIYVGPKPRSMYKDSEIGFYVITPLLPIPNEPNSVKSPILVNRGWVPLDWKEPSLESLGTCVDVAAAENKLISSQQNLLSKFLSKFNNPMIAKDQGSRAMHVEVVGLVRKNETPGIYTLVNYPRSLSWFYLDVPKLAQAMGFGEDTIYIEDTHNDLDKSKPYPVPRDVHSLIFSKHLPLGYYYHTLLCFWSSLFCFGKAKSILLEKYTNYKVKLELFLLILVIYIATKIYSLRSLFSKIDTIGVGCVTKLDSGKANEHIYHNQEATEQTSQVKDSP